MAIKSGNVAKFEPMLVSASEAARIAGISPAMWWKLKYSGRCPAPVRLGKRLLWRVEELRQWIDDGCPPFNRHKAEIYRKERALELARLKKAG